MTEKIFTNKYRYDIGLEEGVGAHLVTWVTGLMVFFVTLALAVNFALTTITQDWMSGLSGSLTVEIRPPLGAETPTIEQMTAFNKKTEKILWLAKQHPAVSSARALSSQEIRALIEPWLGEKMAEGMALPAFELPLNLALPPGYRLLCTIGTAVAAGHELTVVGGKY